MEQEEDKLLCELTDAEWKEFKEEYKKYWEEHKEEIKKDMLGLFRDDTNLNKKH